MDHIDEEETRQGSDAPQPNCTDRIPLPQPPLPPCCYFDYIFGASTGGLIAIMLGRLRMGVDEALEAYKTFAGKVFERQRWLSFFGLVRDMYDHRILKTAIDEVVEKRRTDTSIPVKSEPSEPEDHDLQRILPLQSDEPRRDDMQKSSGGALNSVPTFNSDPTMCRTYAAHFFKLVLINPGNSHLIEYALPTETSDTRKGYPFSSAATNIFPTNTVGHSNPAPFRQPPSTLAMLMTNGGYMSETLALPITSPSGKLLVPQPQQQDIFNL